MDKIEIKGQYTWSEAGGAYRGAYKATKWWARISQLGGIIFLFLLLTAIQDLGVENPRIIMIGYIAIGVFVFIPSARSFVSDNKKKEWQEDKTWSAEFELTITLQGLFQKNRFGSKEYMWGDFIRWREDEDYIYFFLSYANFWFIPKRMLNPDELAFLNHQPLDNKIIKTNGRTLKAETLIWWLGSGLILLIQTVLSNSSHSKIISS